MYAARGLMTSRSTAAMPSVLPMTNSGCGEALGVGCRHEALLGDDAGDELRRCHVERRIADRGLGWRDADGVERDDLGGRPLLDRDLAAVGRVEVDGADRRHDEERDAV